MPFLQGFAVPRVPLVMAFAFLWRKSKFYGATLNRRVVLHAIDATVARWRGDAGCLAVARPVARTGSFSTVAEKSS